METLSFVSVVPWEIVTQLINLLLLFLLVRHFLFKPVNSILAQRQEEINHDYEEAEKAQDEAFALRDEYQKRIGDAKAEASDILKTAAAKASQHSEEIVLEAQQQAARLKEKADEQIALEKKKAMNELKDEISGIAVDIASKVVEREINAKDHEALIKEFIEGVGEAS